MKLLKLYGERNTGTSYLLQLLASNLDVRIFTGVIPSYIPFGQFEKVKDFYFRYFFKFSLGWKHAVPNIDLLKKQTENQNVCFVTLTKNPYSFLLSLYKNPYHYGKQKPASFSAFLRSRYLKHDRDNCSSLYYENPCVIWNVKNSSYLELKRVFEDTVNLKYEELLVNPSIAIKRISAAHELPFKKSEFVNITQSTKNSTNSFSTYKDYYLNEKWRDDLSNEDIEFINSQLDIKILKRFGYEEIL